MALKKTVRGKQRLSNKSILSKNNLPNNELKIQDALNKYHNYLEVEKIILFILFKIILKILMNSKNLLMKKNMVIY